ncbi:hypothetical protein BX616_010297 [Lobosporangium transversale]|nr:hypothetical protein BX616_010297 [Lobosporangium transversale]
MSDSDSSESSSTTSSYTESITSTILSTISETFSLPTETPGPSPTPTAPSFPSPTAPSTPSNPSSDPSTINDGNPYLQTNLLCDWTKTVVHCRDSDFVKQMLVVSSAAHLAAALFGIWLLSYRNRGFNPKIITDLFIKVGTGVRPKPVLCNLLIILDALQEVLWLRVAIEQLYWAVVAFGFSSYFVGLLYAMPVTTREGIFAVYQPEVVYGDKPLPPIHVLTPTTIQKNFMLIIGAVYPAVFGAGLGIASSELERRGYYEASRILFLLQYSNWVVIMYVMSALFFYYGLKYTFILRANIIVAEAALKAPRAAFGIGNLKSRSPARFLFIQLQITGFGGCAVTLLAGTLCIIWVLLKDKILEMPNERLPHVMAVFWTCAIALAYFVAMALIAAQTVRNRRRGLHEQSTTTATGTLSRSGGDNGQRNIIGSGRLSKSEQHSHQHEFDPEAQLRGHSSGDLSSLEHEKVSVSKERLNEQYEIYPRYMSVDGHHQADRDRAVAAASVVAMVALSDRMDQEANALSRQSRDSFKSPTSPTSPSRSFSTQANNKSTSTNNNVHNNLRESVFGGRTPREDGMPGSPPANGGGGFSLPSFPLMGMRSPSRNSNYPQQQQQQQQQQRPSISSRTHTTSTNSSKFSSGSNKYGTSSDGSIMPPLSPTSPIMAPALALQQQTQQQLQQLEQQSLGHGSRASTQRIQVMSGGFQAIPERGAYGGMDEDDGPSLPQMPLPPSSPPHSPLRTKLSGFSSSPRIMQASSLAHQQQYQHQLQQQYHDITSLSRLPRRSNSSSRSGSNYKDLSINIPLPPDMQLQQQHPLHQVAYKGLSPPPRSVPLSPTRRTGGQSMRTNKMSPPTSPILVSGSVATSPFAMPGSHPLDSHNGSCSPRLSPSQQAFQLDSSTQSPRLGNGVRRVSSSTAASPTIDKDKESGSANTAASRGAGGGYQAQRTEPPPTPQPSIAFNTSPKTMRQHTNAFGVPQQQGIEAESDDSQSVDSGGVDAWPMPPTFK